MISQPPLLTCKELHKFQLIRIKNILTYITTIETIKKGRGYLLKIQEKKGKDAQILTVSMFSFEGMWYE